jgi:type I restriction enzyme, S subunit
MSSTWTEVKWGDVFDIQGGTQPPKAQFVTEPKEGYIRLIQIRDFESDKYKVYIPDTKKLKKANEEDIFIARYGASIGRILRGLSGAYNVALAKVLIDENKFDRDFIYYFLKSSIFQNEVTKISSRSAQSGFNKQDLANIDVPQPSILEQKKIAKIISSVDNEIEKTEEIINQSVKIKKGLLQQLLTKGIGHTKFKETEIGEIPEEWEIGTLQDYCEHITKGATPTTYGYDWVSEGILFLRNECVKESRLTLKGSSFISDEAHQAMNRSKIKLGDILITITGNLGQTCIYDKGPTEANINQHIARVRIINDYVKAKFVCYFLNSNFMRKQYELIKTGLAYPQLSLKQIQEIRFPIPTLEEQNKIIEIISTVDSKIEYENDILTNLQNIRDGLMQVLLTGKVRVKVNEEEVITS